MIQQHRGFIAGLTHPIVALGAACGAAIALYPNMIARSTTLTVLLTSGAVVITTLIGAACARLVPAFSRRGSAGVFAAAGTLLITATAVHTWWQNLIRADLGAPPTGWLHAPTVAMAAVVVFAAMTRLPRMALATLIVACGVGAGLLSAPVAASPVSSTAAVSTATVSTATVPTSTDAPGSGSAAPTAHFLRATGDLDTAVASVVGRWRSEHTSFSTGRRAVVIAVPTGSGWVDA